MIKSGVGGYQGEFVLSEKWIELKDLIGDRGQAESFPV